MGTNQSDVQASIRKITGTSGTYNEDWSALFDMAGVPEGDFNGRWLTWLNSRFTYPVKNINDALALFAKTLGSPSWNELGSFYIADFLTSSVHLFSFRNVSVTYKGPALRVRRDNDDAELDIGFTPDGDFDAATMLEFVGSNSGYLSVWYDQSPNGYHAIQANLLNQPRVVNSGVLETANGLPTARFLNPSSTFMIAPGPGVVGGLTVAMVHTWDVTETTYATIVAENYTGGAGDGTWQILKAETLPNLQASQLFNWSYTNSIASVEYPTNTPLVTTVNFSPTGSLLQNNSLVASATFDASQTVDSIIIGGWNGGRYFNGCLSELMTFSPTLFNTDSQILNKNMGSYYGITVS